MSEHSTTSPGGPLLHELLALLLSHRGAFRQERTFGRMQALIFGYLFSFARRTVTQVLLALGLTDDDWSAFYRLFNGPRIDYEELTGCFLSETLENMPETGPYVVVVDGVQVPRHSHKMTGTSWLKNPRTPPFMPGIHRAQRFLHLAALLPQSDEGYSRALPLRWEPAFPEKAVLAEGMEPRKEWEAALDSLRWLRKRLDEAGRRTQRLLVLGDGGFCVAGLFRALPQSVDLMARCAKNRALYAFFQQRRMQARSQTQVRREGAEAPRVAHRTFGLAPDKVHGAWQRDPPTLPDRRTLRAQRGTRAPRFLASGQGRGPQIQAPPQAARSILLPGHGDPE